MVDADLDGLPIVDVAAVVTYRWLVRQISVRWPVAIALVGAALGLVMAGLSTLDYAAHLDRQLHDVHCSYIPGAGADPSADNSCRAAFYSPYAALFRDRIWGGVPISLLAVGAFSFFIAFAVYLLVSGERAPRRATQFMALGGVTPALVSIVMAVISAVKLGTFCKTCVGIYIASALLAVGGVAAWWIDRKQAARPPPFDADSPPMTRQPAGAGSLIFTWLLLLALFALAPALLYHESVPSYGKRVRGCGKLASADDPKDALIHISPRGAKQPVVMVVDPLCTTCKTFHERLIAEDVFDQLDITLVLFPLDSECNWNLTAPLYPGSCTLSKAVLCMEDRALQALEWSYDEQEALTAVAKKKNGETRLRKKIEARWQGLEACLDAKATGQRLDEMIRFAVTNKLPVSTPQLFIGDTRLCEEDSDIGLPYALRKLAPELRK